MNMISLDEEDEKLIAKKNRGLTEARFSIPAWTDKVMHVYDKALRKG